jgi:hypothetical protein
MDALTSDEDTLPLKKVIKFQIINIKCKELLEIDATRNITSE